MSEFVFAAPLSSLKSGEITAVDVGGHFLALYLVDGTPYCTEDLCTHEGQAMSSGGWVDNDEVECPWHGARFNVKTGAVTSLPADAPIRTFPVTVRDDQVFVSLD